MDHDIVFSLLDYSINEAYSEDEAVSFFMKGIGDCRRMLSTFIDIARHEREGKYLEEASFHC